MEWNDEQLLARKIGELDSLPDGYAPDLELKFELLQEALPKRGKRRALLLWRITAVAACLLLVLAAMLFRPLQQAPQETNVARTVAKTPQPVIPVAPVPVSSSPAAALTAVTAKKAVSKKAKLLPSGPQQVMLPATPVDSSNTIALLPQIRQPNPDTFAAAGVTLVQQHAKKRRYARIDFDENLHTGSEGTASSNRPSGGVSIRFLQSRNGAEKESGKAASRSVFNVNL